MDHACKLCDRIFANGRALGGHMKAHMAVLPPAKKWRPGLCDEELQSEEDERIGVVVCYGLSENPKRSVVEEWESEGESPCRRWKRSRRSEEEELAVSSISDASSDEDVALCLMMLSQDVWSSSLAADDVGEEDDGEYKSAAPASVLPGRGGRYKYQCETCSRVFRSYQALGGHRAGHKKNRARLHSTIAVSDVIAPAAGEPEEKIHQCPVCDRVFASGQALGGHKRSHLSGAAVAAVTAGVKSGKPEETLIDLNLPASMEEEEDSPVELSAISDEEFANSYI